MNIRAELHLHFLVILLSVFFKTAIALNVNEENTIEMDLSNYIPVIKGQIADKKINLLFDTGATSSLILNETLLRTIGRIKRTGKIRKYIDSAGKITVLDELIIPEISIDSLISYNVNTYLYRPWGLKFSSNTENLKEQKQEGHIASDFHESQSGVVGFEFFKNKKIIIDYLNKKIVVFNGTQLPKPYHSKKWFSTNVNIDERGLVLTGILKNKKALFLLDTGATASILHSRVFQNKKKQAKVDVNFNGYKIKNHLFQLVAYQEPQVDGILGYNFFKEVLVYLDFERKELYFAHYNEG